MFWYFSSCVSLFYTSIGFNLTVSKFRTTQKAVKTDSQTSQSVKIALIKL